jgi:tRNA threonylcarbamoyladenosine biosynthesis protein TsaB
VLLLALDNAEAACSAALWDDARPAAGALLGHRRLSATRGQADHLIRLIDELLTAAGCDYAALDALAVNCGPGSFTGLRSVVAAGRGLALAAGLPVVAVGSLEALAEAVRGAPAGPLVAALDARRGEIYLQAFDRHGRPRAAPLVMTPQQAVAGLGPGPLRLVGSGAPLLRAALPEHRVAILERAELDARWVASCAARRLAGGEVPQPGHTLRPLYLRPPDARPLVPVVAPARAEAVEA